jgi:hypothetical protein
MNKIRYGADVTLTFMQHQQPVKTDCNAGAGWQSRTQCVDEFLVNLMDWRLTLAACEAVAFEAG